MGMMETVVTTIKGLFGGKDESPVYDDDLVAFVDKEFQRRQKERQPYELYWKLNLAFYEGNQYLDINTASLQLEEMPILYDWQEREVFNHIAPNIETRISKFKRVRSLLKVRPGGDGKEAEDLHSAKVGTLFLRNNYNDLDIRDIEVEELGWMEICGTVFRKHIWNPAKGRVIGQRIIQDESGEEVVEDIREGDMEIIVVPPQEIYPDSSYRNSIEDCKSLIHARAFHIDDIKDIWGVEVRAEQAEAEKLQRMMNGLGGLGYGQGGFMYHNVKLENHAIVKEYQERPSKKYPEGRLIIVAGGKLLYAGKLPYLVGDDKTPGFNFTMLKCLHRAGVFWGKTVLERLIPVQRRYNALRNRKAEYLNRCAIGQYIVEDGSLVDEDAFERDAGMPGAIHTINRGAKPPLPMENAVLPTSFETEEQTLLNEFAILSGVSEISRQSNAPPGVKSGVALAIVQEQDDTRVSNTVDNIERFRIQSGKLQLRLAKQFVKAPRTLRAVGKNNIAEVIDWMGSDLKSEDVILDTIMASAESPAQKRQMVFDLLESGLLFDPDTGKLNKEMRSKIFDMIDLGEWESADDTEQLHLAKAERENRMFEQGQLTQAANYDDHIIHLSRHNAYRLTVDYEELKAKVPVIEQIFEAHVNMHLMLIQQQAMSARAQMMPAGGGDSAA